MGKELSDLGEEIPAFVKGCKDRKDKELKVGNLVTGKAPVCKAERYCVYSTGGQLGTKRVRVCGPYYKGKA